MPNERMTASGFREALAIIGETPASFAEFLVSLGDVGDHKARTVARWASGALDIPGPIQALLQVLVLLVDQADISPTTLRAWLADAVPADATEGTNAAP